MIDSHLLLILITTCVFCPSSVAIGSYSNEHVSVQRRTWDQAMTMAKSLVAQSTMEEKCNMTSSVPGLCVGTKQGGTN